MHFVSKSWILDFEIKIGMMQCKDNGARRVVADLFVEGELKFDHFLNL